MSAVPPSILAAPQAQVKPPAKIGTPRISVVIVNYRQWDETEELVRHLQNSASIKTGAAEIVLSAAYRQASKVSAQRVAADPSNEFLGGSSAPVSTPSTHLCHVS